MSAHVFDPAVVLVGDEIAYVGERKRGGYPEPRAGDWLRVNRITDGDIYGEKVNPEEWQEGVEFVVVRRQVEDNGVIIAARGGVSSATPEEETP